MPERNSFPLLRLLGVLVLMLFFASRATAAPPGQDGLFMQVSNAPGQSYTIKVQGYPSPDGFMTDMAAFARALRLGSVFDGSRMQIDEAFGKSVTSCVLREGSPFVVIDSASGTIEKRIVQLAAAPSVRAGRLYLPVSQACRTFSLWLGSSVRYDPVSNRISANLGGRLPDAGSRVGLLPISEPVRSAGVTGSLPPAASPSGKPGTDRSPAGKSSVNDVRVETLANGVVIRFLASGVKRPASFLRPDSRGTAYLTIENMAGDPSRLGRSYPGGIVQSITPVQLGNGAMQFNIALDTAGYAVKSSSFRYDASGNEYVVSIMSNVDVDAIRRTEKERLIQERLSHEIDKWKLDAVVIDAGHGGKDPGAIGTRGTREKDVVLNIASDLGMFIKQKWPDIKVIYTRKDDRFIPLKERGKIANRYGGKLFISIHCNSTAGNSKVRGPEVYILGPHKTQSALKVAMLENSVITGEENYRESYKGFSDEYLIMSSMAQSAFAMQSTELAQALLGRLDRRQSNNGNGVRQAGFMVLWTPSMPSILVEAGYLSNPDEEKILRDRKEQTRIAYEMFQGLQHYRASYESRMMASGYAR